MPPGTRALVPHMLGSLTILNRCLLPVPTAGACFLFRPLLRRNVNSGPDGHSRYREKKISKHKCPTALLPAHALVSNSRSTVTLGGDPETLIGPWLLNQGRQRDSVFDGHVSPAQNREPRGPQLARFRCAMRLDTPFSKASFIGDAGNFCFTQPCRMTADTHTRFRPTAQPRGMECGGATCMGGPMKTG